MRQHIKKELILRRKTDRHQAATATAFGNGECRNKTGMQGGNASPLAIKNQFTFSTNPN